MGRTARPKSAVGASNRRVLAGLDSVPPPLVSRAMSHRFVVPIAVLGLVAPAACSSGDEGVPEAVVERLTAGIDEIEAADGMHFEVHIEVGNANDPGSDPDVSECVTMSIEPSGTAPTGERLEANLGTPHVAVGCNIGSWFTVDGTRVYVPTDERAPGLLGHLNLVGETTPELIAEMTTDETEPALDPSGIVAAATRVDEVDDDKIVFELDPTAVSDLGRTDLPDPEAIDSLSLTVEFDPNEHDRLVSLRYEALADDVIGTTTYLYDALNEPQDVEIPGDQYLAPEVTQLTTVDELTAFVGWDGA
jgi:hypothetical protein